MRSLLNLMSLLFSHFLTQLLHVSTLAGLNAKLAYETDVTPFEKVVHIDFSACRLKYKM